MLSNHHLISHAAEMKHEEAKVEGNELLLVLMNSDFAGHVTAHFTPPSDVITDY